MVLTSLRWALLIQHPTSASTGEILMSAEAQCVLSLYLLDGGLWGIREAPVSLLGLWSDVSR